MIASPRNLIGNFIGGYRLDSLIGAGRMGATFVASNADEQTVAVKILVPPVLASDEVVEEFHTRFRAEARRITQMDHPHILPLEAFGADEDTRFAYMVMPYLKDGSLLKHLEAEPLAFERVIAYVQQIAAALDYAHNQSILHCDLKPSNVLFAGQDKVYLTDFSMIKLFDLLPAATPHANLGTATTRYMAPEQVSNQRLSPATDVYGLGLLAYQMLTGRVPFKNAIHAALLQQIAHTPPPSPREFRPELPEPAVAALLRALAKDPLERFAWAGDFARALLEGLDGKSHTLSSVHLQATQPLSVPEIFSSATDPSHTTALTPAEPGSQPAAPVIVDEASADMPTAAVQDSESTSADGTAPMNGEVEGAPDSAEATHSDVPLLPADVAGERTGNALADMDTLPPGTDNTAFGIDTSTLLVHNLLESAEETATPPPIHRVRLLPDEASAPSRTGDLPPFPAGGRTQEPAATGDLFPASGPLVLPDLPPVSVKISKVKPLRAKKRRPLWPLLAALLSVLLLLGSILYVSGIGLPFLGKIARDAPQLPTPTPTLPPASSATITITPDSQLLDKTVTITAVTGTPDAAQHQVQSRWFAVADAPQARTVNATGVSTVPGTPASGVLTIINHDPLVAQTINAGTVLTNQRAPVLGLVIDQTVTLPPDAGVNASTQNVRAHVAQPGTVGNIPTVSATGGFLFQSAPGCSVRGQRCWLAANFSPFTGGTDPQQIAAVQQSDIDGAANALIAAHPVDAQGLLQSRLLANERLISTPSCQPKTTSDHAVNDKVPTFTVTVTITCVGLVYDQDGALSAAGQKLKDLANDDPGSGYALVGNISSTFKDAQISDAAQGTVSVNVDAKGTWTYQLTDAQKADLAKALVGRSKFAAQVYLNALRGLKNATIDLSGGDRNTFPGDAKKITITVQPGA